MKLATECISHKNDWEASSEKRFVKIRLNKTEKVRKVEGLCNFSCCFNW